MNDHLTNGTYDAVIVGAGRAWPSAGAAASCTASTAMAGNAATSPSSSNHSSGGRRGCLRAAAGLRRWVGIVLLGAVRPRPSASAQRATQLGCRFLDEGAVETTDLGQTSTPGVYAAGDMARRPTMPLPGAQVVIAAAEGTTAAIVIDQELLYA